VNETPGWSVSMPPSEIGVPVALTPGLVPHAEVATVCVVPAGLLAVVTGLAVPPVLELLQAATLIMVTAPTSAADTRAPSAWLGTFTYVHLLVAKYVHMAAGRQEEAIRQWFLGHFGQFSLIRKLLLSRL
jgi:hypothetical protein